MFHEEGVSILPRVKEWGGWGLEGLEKTPQKTERSWRRLPRAPTWTGTCSVLVRVRTRALLRDTQRLLQGHQRPVGSDTHRSDHVLPVDTKRGVA